MAQNMPLDATDCPEARFGGCTKHECVYRHPAQLSLRLCPGWGKTSGGACARAECSLAHPSCEELRLSDCPDARCSVDACAAYPLSLRHVYQETRCDAWIRGDDCRAGCHSKHPFRGHLAPPPPVRPAADRPSGTDRPSGAAGPDKAAHSGAEPAAHQKHSEAPSFAGRQPSAGAGQQEAAGGRMDVCFVLDATVSMERHIASMKSNILGVIDEMLRRGVALRMACVAYRDWAADGSEPTAEPRLQIQPFTTDAAAFRRFLDGINAEGGWDEPEDVAGALQAAVDCTVVGPDPAAR
jgi:hypothetical protein